MGTALHSAWPARDTPNLNPQQLPHLGTRYFKLTRTTYKNTIYERKEYGDLPKIYKTHEESHDHEEDQN